MGLRDPHFAKSEDDLIREVLGSGDASVAGITLERLADEHSVRLQVGRPYLPFANGAPTPSGKVEFLSETMAREGLPALPTYVPLVEGPEHAALLERYPLQCIVPPNRFFLNSSFSQSERGGRRGWRAPVRGGRPPLADERDRAVDRPAPARPGREYRAQDEFLVIPGFLPPAAVGALLDDVRRLEPGLNRNYIPRHKKGGSVSHFAIADGAPALLALYRSDRVRRFLARLVRADLHVCPDE